MLSRPLSGLTLALFVVCLLAAPPLAGAAPEQSLTRRLQAGVPVAILGSDRFDVADIDVTTLAFGPDGAAPLHSVGGHLGHVGNDGYRDLLMHFAAQETGLAPGDGKACVTGELLGGTPFESCDSVRIVPK